MKPMLSGKCTDVSKLRFPVLGSPKLDGIRCLVLDGVAYSRNMKPIPNRWVQEQVAGWTGIDGELIAGSPNAPDVFRRTTSAVMSASSPDEQNVKLYAFDSIGDAFDPGTPFRERLYSLDHCDCDIKVDLEHVELYNPDEVLEYERKCLEEGYEGIMLRDPNGPYKEGRSTEREGWLLKLKQFEDAEAVVIGTQEKMHNANEATIDELGRTKRSSHKAGKEATGVLGALIVRGVGSAYKGVEFNIGTGFDDAQRAELWAIRNQLVNSYVKYRYFPSGSKDAPRFPVFVGFRDPGDM